MIDLEKRNLEILRLAEQGKSAREIMEALGLKSRNVAIGVISRAKETGWVPGKVWTPPASSKTPLEVRMQRNERRRLRAAETAADKLRVKLAEAEAREALLRQQAEERAERIRAQQEQAKKALDRLPAPSTVRWKSDTRLDPAKGVSILDIRFGQCRWVQPHKYRGLAVFCGDAVKPGKAFCPEHHKLCYVRPTAGYRRGQPPINYSVAHSVRAMENTK